MPQELREARRGRVEDLRFLTGRGDYVADRAVPGCLQLRVLRSPHAHARIRRIDASAARALPGVRAVLTGADYAADGLGTMPCLTVLDAVEKLIVPPRPALALDTVRHVGDPVACILAESAAAAQDAAEAIEVEYEVLPCVTDPARAVLPEAPRIWPLVPGNSAFLFRKGDREAVAAAFAGAAHVVSRRLLNNRVMAAPLEPRAAIGSHDAATDELHLVLTGQAVHAQRQQIADVLGLPAERLRLTVPDVGGGFGVKNFCYPEWVLVLWAARRLGRPVRWIGERMEDCTGSAHGREMLAEARLALDAEGRFLALDVRGIAAMGAYLSSNGPLSPTMSAASAMGGIYDIPAIAMEMRGVFTNTPPVDAYRGAGKPEANYIIERLIDAAAAETGLDAAMLRRGNAMTSFPHRTAMGMVVDGGRFRANLEDAIRHADRAAFAARRRLAAAAGRLRGQGIACFLETARGMPNEFARIAFEADGGITLAIGTQSNGQGHETTYPAIVAGLLGLPQGRFRFRQGDTALLPGGHGHGGARSMQLGGSALLLAVDGLLDKGRRIAAHLLQAPPDAVRFADGVFALPGTDRRIDIDAVAAAAADAANLPDGVAPGFAHGAEFRTDLYGFPNGCHVAEVEIDPETGAVRLERYDFFDDFGRLLDPRLTLGQVQGGVAQGIGQALLELVVFDPENGQPLSGSLMDYALPRADDLPDLDGRLHQDAPTAANRLGVKGSGQAGAIAAPQAVMSAVMDALAPAGVRHLDMPATPFRVWSALRAAARGDTSR